MSKFFCPEDNGRQLHLKYAVRHGNFSLIRYGRFITFEYYQFPTDYLAKTSML